MLLIHFTKNKAATLYEVRQTSKQPPQTQRKQSVNQLRSWLATPMKGWGCRKWEAVATGIVVTVTWEAAVQKKGSVVRKLQGCKV